MMLGLMVRPAEAQWTISPESRLAGAPHGVMAPVAVAPAQLAPADLSEACVVRVVVTAAFLNRMLQQCQVQASPVRDCILGADVFGDQQTETCHHIELRPCATHARFVFVLEGKVANQTVSVTPQAAIQTVGSHDFRLLKQIDFNGQEFTTRSPEAWVTPRLSHQGAQTPVSGWPLLGPLASGIALSESERRRPEAEWIASQRITDQSAPRFNSEVDRHLGRANALLKNRLPTMLGSVGLSLDHLRLISQESQFAWGVVPPTDAATSGAWPLLPGNSEAASPVPLPTHRTGQAVTVAIHESAVNGLLRRLPLGGMEVADTQIDQLLELLLGILGRGSLGPIPGDLFGAIRLSADSPPPEFSTLLMDREQPLSVQYDDGTMRLRALCGFRPVLTPAVPPQWVEIPLRLQRRDGQFVLEPGEVAVTSPPGAVTSPLVELARPVVRAQVSQRLKTLPLAAQWHLDAVGLPSVPSTPLQLVELVIDDGWLIIGLD
jgi:hypothetical protein